MERLKPPEQLTVRKGVSLKELVPYVIKRHQGKPGQPISERVVRLSEYIETESFWFELNRHMAEDKDERKRHSVGGIFFGEYGREPVGQYYTWFQVFTSLDHFLREFDMRATEFIFRDFQPQNPDRNLARMMDATRELALDKYPRLRRLYRDDYQEVLNTPSFWRSLTADLANLPKPTATYTFFDFPKFTKEEKDDIRDIKTVLQRTFRRQFWLAQGQIGRRARSIEYYNLAQIIRRLFEQDTRTFLLNFTPQSDSLILNEAIEQAKGLLENKLLPVQPKPEPMAKMDRQEFQETVESKEFWFSLVTDIEDHANSQNQAYSLSYFLRHYSRDEKEIFDGRPGTYARLATIYLRSTKGFRQKSVRASRQLVQHLMWQFQPREELVPLVLRAKALCAEMFPQDCLYVELQTPEFWDEFGKDAEKMDKKHRLYSFLRYFSQENPTCDRRRHRPGISKYQRLLHRAYHEQKEFLQLLPQIGIDNVADWKDGLSELFWRTAPEEIKPLLFEKFPRDFSPEQRQQRLKAVKLLSEAKNVLKRLSASQEKKTRLEFADKKEAIKFRSKLWSAARTLRIRILTDLNDTSLTVSIGKRIQFSKRERPRFELQVKKLRLQGRTNQEIAERLGVKDYHVEHTARKLMKKGKIESRRKRLS